ncbi:hexosaminidase [Pustulibacterium marinum]|uniref:Hexosaminidase n=1 Tax=Pustulibacterium marinum TaxID=1224947 RepID=A0A1I7G4D7_9FLAO|nr:family 20 glycosylhydrolase [Pustulibacterium marinum]SFU43201.1 hexosaminidase [Pustulibacterium marinum]
MLKKILTLVFVTTAIFIGNAQEANEVYNIIPWPAKVKTVTGSCILNEDFKVNIQGDYHSRIYGGASRFLRRLADKTGVFIDQGFATKKNEYPNAILQISIERPGVVKLGEDESYSLDVSEGKIILKSTTDIGALRGLETLLQLVSFSETEYFFQTVKIEDEPRFPWRGLMMDVSRHFMPVDVVKRNIDALAAAKMNVFHWHLADDQGWRVEIKSLPELTEKGSDGFWFTQEQIKDVVAYAVERGIRVIPEIDVPGHATAMSVAYPQISSKKDTVYTIERYAGVFDPTLDPTIDETYEVLEKVIAEMAPLFPDPYFHIGGDENEGKQWAANEDIQKFMKEHDLKDKHQLQSYFNIKLQKILKKYGKIMMGWDEIFQPELPKDVVIQSWRGKEAMIQSAQQGSQTILSNGYYIDLNNSMKGHYLNDPLEKDNPLTPQQAKNILGGEATMWAELATPLTVDSRIWPRTAAIAERLWSSQDVNDYDNLRKRLVQFNLDLELLGITHLSYRDVILRNMANGRNIMPLQNMTAICEPLKGYTRNMGGTEYKTYNPYTLFADACVVDASDAVAFKHAVAAFIQKHNEENRKAVKIYLQKWATLYDDLKTLQPNPTLQKIMPIAERVQNVCKPLLAKMNGEKAKLKKKDFKVLEAPVEDVEIVITTDLQLLFEAL